MKTRFNSIALAGLVAIGAASAAMAQTPEAGGAKAGAYRAPRLGKHPDLSGVWQVMNTAEFNIEAHAASAALQMRPGRVVPVPAKEVLALGAVGSVPPGLSIVEGGTIPYKPEALKQRDANKADWIHRDPEIKCYLPGVPRANYMSLPFQILQSDNSITIAYEYANATRHVVFKDPGAPPFDSWMGQSVAHWEGDTLVVVVTGMNDSTWFDRAGNFHSADMKVVERWTLTGPGVMRYEAEITDPNTFTRSWKMGVNLYRHVGEDARLLQFNCVEFVEELMYGSLRKHPLD